MAGGAGQRETPDAETAFADFVALGPDRSLAKLHAAYQSDPKSAPTTRLRTLKTWSAKYGWQNRIRQASTERAERMLEEAANLDADTFLRSSKLINDRIRWTDAGHIDAVIKMRESVRKPQPKGGTSVSVKVSVEVRQLAEQMAKELGMDADELIAEAERIAQNQWETA